MAAPYSLSSDLAEPDKVGEEGKTGEESSKLVWEAVDDPSPAAGAMAGAGRSKWRLASGLDGALHTLPILRTPYTLSWPGKGGDSR